CGAVQVAVESHSHRGLWIVTVREVERMHYAFDPCRRDHENRAVTVDSAAGSGAIQLTAGDKRQTGHRFRSVRAVCRFAETPQRSQRAAGAHLKYAPVAVSSAILRS